MHERASERASMRACERSPSVLCACLVLVPGGAGWLCTYTWPYFDKRSPWRPRKLLSNPPKKCYFQNEEKTLPCLSQTGESFSSFWKTRCLRWIRSPCGRSHSLSHPRVLSRPPLARLQSQIPTHPSTHPPIHPPTHPPIHPPTHPHAHPPTHPLAIRARKSILGNPR